MGKGIPCVGVFCHWVSILRFGAGDVKEKEEVEGECDAKKNLLEAAVFI